MFTCSATHRLVWTAHVVFDDLFVWNVGAKKNNKFKCSVRWRAVGYRSAEIELSLAHWSFVVFNASDPRCMLESPHKEFYSPSRKTH